MRQVDRGGRLRPQRVQPVTTGPGAAHGAGGGVRPRAQLEQRRHQPLQRGRAQRPFVALAKRPQVSSTPSASTTSAARTGLRAASRRPGGWRRQPFGQRHGAGRAVELPQAGLRQHRQRHAGLGPPARRVPARRARPLRFAGSTRRDQRRFPPRRPAPGPRRTRRTAPGRGPGRPRARAPASARAVRAGLAQVAHGPWHNSVRRCMNRAQGVCAGRRPSRKARRDGCMTTIPLLLQIASRIKCPALPIAPTTF